MRIGDKSFEVKKTLGNGHTISWGAILFLRKNIISNTQLTTKSNLLSVTLFHFYKITRFNRL